MFLSFAFLVFVLYSCQSKELHSQSSFNLEKNSEGCFEVSVPVVTDNFATINWKLEDSECCMGYNIIELKCVGKHHFIDTDGNRKKDKIKSTQYFPAKITQALVSDLKPNMKFECEISFIERSTIPDHIFKFMATNFDFKTPIAAPEPPQKPNVVESDKNGHLYTIELHNTTTRNGPVIGYEVQFFPVDDDSVDDDEKHMFSSVTHKPFGNIPLVKDIDERKEPHSFCYRYEGHRHRLPSLIVIDDKLLQNSLKIGSSYVVVTVAYTKLNDQILYSESEVSDVFTLRKKATATVSASLLKKRRLESFRKSYRKQVAFIGVCAVPLGGVVFCLISSFVYNKMTKNYKMNKRLDYYNKRMKKSVRLDPNMFIKPQPLDVVVQIDQPLPPPRKREEKSHSKVRFSSPKLKKKKNDNATAIHHSIGRLNVSSPNLRSQYHSLMSEHSLDKRDDCSKQLSSENISMPAPGSQCHEAMSPDITFPYSQTEDNSSISRTSHLPRPPEHVIPKIRSLSSEILSPSSAEIIEIQSFLKEEQKAPQQADNYSVSINGSSPSTGSETELWTIWSPKNSAHQAENSSPNDSCFPYKEKQSVDLTPASPVDHPDSESESKYSVKSLPTEDSYKVTKSRRGSDQLIYTRMRSEDAFPQIQCSFSSKDSNYSYEWCDFAPSMEIDKDELLKGWREVSQQQEQEEETEKVNAIINYNFDQATYKTVDIQKIEKPKKFAWKSSCENFFKLIFEHGKSKSDPGCYMEI